MSSLRFTVERQFTERRQAGSHDPVETIAAFDTQSEAIRYAESLHDRLDGKCMLNVWDEQPEARNGERPSAVRVHVIYRETVAA